MMMSRSWLPCPFHYLFLSALGFCLSRDVCDEHLPSSMLDAAAYGGQSVINYLVEIHRR